MHRACISARGWSLEVGNSVAVGVKLAFIVDEFLLLGERHYDVFAETFVNEWNKIRIRIDDI